MILPMASKTVLIGRSEYQSLLDGVRLINLGLEKKEETVLKLKSKVIYIYNICVQYN